MNQVSLNGNWCLFEGLFFGGFYVGRVKEIVDGYYYCEQAFRLEDATWIGCCHFRPSCVKEVY